MSTIQRSQRSTLLPQNAFIVRLNSSNNRTPSSSTTEQREQTVAMCVEIHIQTRVKKLNLNYYFTTKISIIYKSGNFGYFRPKCIL